MPQIEEILDDQDIDNMDFDPADFEPSNPFSTDTPVESGVRLRPVQQDRTPPPPSSSSQAGQIGMEQMVAAASQMNSAGSGAPPAPTFASGVARNEVSEEMKSWKVLYPCYFDKRRSLAEGRRVPMDLAVNDPLAITLAEACESLGYQVSVELVKSHPQDWANLGRVRVNTTSPKRNLYADVSMYLKLHPTTERSAYADDYRRVAHFDSIRPLAKPLGIKMNDILPGVSPALSAQKEIEKAMTTDVGRMFGMGGK